MSFPNSLLLIMESVTKNSHEVVFDDNENAIIQYNNILLQNKIDE